MLITDDAQVERDPQWGDEFVDFVLRNPTGGFALGNPRAALLTIVENDLSAGLQNPADASRFFVLQHYYDFLNRVSDAGGLQFWSNEIEGCGANAGCREAKRVNVSAAFLLSSIEFQETGCLAYRMSKAAYGDAAAPGTVPIVRLDEFLRDTQQLGQGVEVGVGEWQKQLEANKEAYAAEFVRRRRFAAAFPETLTAGQLVERLDQNAGGVLSTEERAALVALLGATPADSEKRAQALRRVAEHAELRRRETNRAFVLMQYFGYPRRNPDDPGFDGQPDPAWAGYFFWLGKLEDHHGNFVQAEMVRAFIPSIEYRQRFGQ